MPSVLSVRIPDEAAVQLRAIARDEDRTVSEIANRALEEYLRAVRFPGIVFVTGPNGRRRARLLAGPDVWEVALVARSYGGNADRIAEHLHMSPATTRMALAYGQAYPNETEAILDKLDALDAGPTAGHPTVGVFDVSCLTDAAPA